MLLDTTAAVLLGYRPVGDYATTVTDEIDWLVATATGSDPLGLVPSLSNRYGTAPGDNADEDAYLRQQPR